MTINKQNTDQIKWAGRVAALTDPTVRNTLKHASDPNVISLAGGIPAPSLFPQEMIQEAMDEIKEEKLDQALQYSKTPGLDELREQIAQNLSQEWDMELSADNILITSGSQQGLDLVGKAFLNQDETVLTEDPTYLVALSAFNGYEVKYESITLQPDGPVLDEVQAQLEKKPKLFYAIPTFQNPSGFTWSQKKREEVINIMEGIPQTPTTIVEDNPYNKLYFDKLSRPLAAIDQLKHTIYLGSFSKSLVPGLRVGYVVAKPDVIDKLTLIKQGMDLHTSTMSQLIVSHVLQKQDKYQAHLKKLRHHYQKQAKLMAKLLKKHLGAQANWNHPEGGMFFWLQIEGANTKELLLKAVEQGLAFMPGYPFYPNKPDHSWLRLSYATASPEEMEEAIKTLGELVKNNT